MIRRLIVTTFILYMTPPDCLSSRLQINLHGAQLRISAPTRAQVYFEIEPILVGNNPEIQWRPKRGLEKFLLDEISLKLNFTYSVFPSSPGPNPQKYPGGSTGFQTTENGSWFGVVGDIVGNKADFGFITAITYSRYQVVDFTTPISYESLTFTLNRPRPSFPLQVLLKSFQLDLWICSCLFVIFFIVVLKIITIFEKSGKPREEFQIGIFCFTLITLLQQPTKFYSGKSSSIRFLIASWLFFAMSLSTAYRSKLVSFMAIPEYRQLPQSFSQLVAASPDEFNWRIEGALIGGAGYDILKRSLNPVHQLILSGQISDPGNDTHYEDCFKNQSPDKLTACITYNGMIGHAIHKNLSNRYLQHNLIISSDKNFFIPIGWALKKGSKLLKYLDPIILRLFDGGILGKWMRLDQDQLHRDRIEWEQQLNKNATGQGGSGEVYNNELDSINLGFEHLIGVWYCLGVGYLVGSSMLVLEVTCQGVKKLMLDGRKKKRSGGGISSDDGIALEPLQSTTSDNVVVGQK